MKRTLAAVFSVLGLSSWACAAVQAASPPNANCAGDVAITHVTVLPMTSVSEQKDQTVLTSKGRIVRIGPSVDAQVPSGACVIDGLGRFLMPGLADAHVHVFDEGDLALYLRFGVTSVLNMSGSHMHLRLREALKAGRVDGPSLYTTGPMLKTHASPLVEFEELPIASADIKDLIASYRAAGYDFVKVWGAFKADMYEAIRDAVRAQHLGMTGHIPRAVGLDGVLAAGQSIAHVEELLNKHFRAVPDAAQMSETASRLVAKGTTVTTTLVVYEAIAAANAKDAASLLVRPGAEFMDPVRLAMWVPDANRMRGIGLDLGPVTQLQSAMQAITLALHKAGVRLLAGTDAGELPGLVPGFDLHRELELIVKAGVSPDDTLRIATANFGNYIANKGDRFGVVEVGARADLLLLDSDPRLDIANTRAIRGVMARGAYYDRATLDALVSRLQQRNNQISKFLAAFSSDSTKKSADYLATLQALGETPTAMFPTLFMGLGLAQRRDLPGAEALLRQVASVFPDREEPWFIIAGIHTVSGDTKGAIAALDEVLTRTPKHERARRDRKLLLEQQQSKPQ